VTALHIRYFSIEFQSDKANVSNTKIIYFQLQSSTIMMV